MESPGHSGMSSGRGKVADNSDRHTCAAAAAEQREEVQVKYGSRLLFWAMSGAKDRHRSAHLTDF